MPLTTYQYGAYYGQYKNAERNISAWLYTISPPNPKGLECQYPLSRLPHLAWMAFYNGHRMTEGLRMEVRTAFEGRVKIFLDHLEGGSATSSHCFPLKYLRTLGRLFICDWQVTESLNELPEPWESECVPGGCSAQLAGIQYHQAQYYPAGVFPGQAFNHHLSSLYPSQSELHLSPCIIQQGLDNHGMYDCATQAQAYYHNGTTHYQYQC